ncbi:hypothetical protein GOP47_0011603 [Adiantum capillus-veneris]|uniref:Uncharacterized protein n=1 Tax=Adiantum capillus-veneris TaxID=13818 RepID=A0A9D4UT30_ADICA|nr:hypothetical protein GOP47_0011603 [Adiantum capillus-veneris]
MSHSCPLIMNVKSFASLDPLLQEAHDVEDAVLKQHQEKAHGTKISRDLSKYAEVLGNALLYLSSLEVFLHKVLHTLGRLVVISFLKHHVPYGSPLHGPPYLRTPCCNIISQASMSHIVFLHKVLRA